MPSGATLEARAWHLYGGPFLLTVADPSMLAFFRRFLSSWMSIAILAIVMIAFIITGVGTPGGGLTGGGVRDDAVANVGGTPVSVATITTRVQSAFRNASEQQPGLTMPAFLSEVGGLTPIVDQYIGAQVLSTWAIRHGITASERLIGGEIASVPAFHGPTGQFDERQMTAVLDQQRMTYATLHDGVREDLIRRQIVVPLTTGARAPDGLLTPYAKLLLDKREGAIVIIPDFNADIVESKDALLYSF
jgi:peptidyl-prolyl cis-trans isomerase D